MTSTVAPSPAAIPSQAHIITSYNLSDGESEVLRCLLAERDKLQHYCRARCAIDHLIKQEERKYYEPQP